MSEKTVKQVLAERGFSRRQISRLNSASRIYLNDRRCRLSETVREGDVLEVRDRVTEPEILYEDECLIVVNKPSGIPCHPSAEHPGEDMGSILQKYCGKEMKIRTAGRLDRQVSGIMIYAKDRRSAGNLSKQREDGTLVKTYYAVCEGVPALSSGIMEYSLDKEPGKKRQGISEKGKKCVTEYCVLSVTDTHALLEVRIKTGRTHQIRAGFSEAGHPLAGDRLYGGAVSLIRRPALHCGKVSFLHPENGALMCIACPLPEDMKALCAQSGQMDRAEVPNGLE